GNFDQGRLYELSSESMGGLQEFPANVKRVSKAYSRHRVWNLGVVLAARSLKLDLSNALVEPGRRIVLRGPNDVERVIPIDHEGRFYIDWSLPFTDRRLTRQPRFATEFSLILLLGFAGGLLTWNLRALIAASCVLVLAVIYLSLGVYFYLEVRYWLPLILPCSALCFTHFTLISYRVVF